MAAPSTTSVRACPVGAVSVPPVRANPRGVLIPLAVWVLLKGGRALCRSCQRAAPLAAVWADLPLEDTADLLAWTPR